MWSAAAYAAQAGAGAWSGPPDPVSGDIVCAMRTRAAVVERTLSVTGMLRGALAGAGALVVAGTLVVAGVLVVAGALVVAGVLAAGPAAAAPPETWPSDPHPVSTLQGLLLFGGVPLALGAVIALLTMAPGVVRGTRERAADRWSEPHWFGGPGSEVAAGPGRPALPVQGERRALTPAPTAGDASTTGGGAGARW